MTAYLMKPSEDDTIEVSIVDGEFAGIGVKYFNMDFSKIHINGETKYDYQLYLKEETNLEDRKSRLEHILDDILASIINDSLKHLRDSHVKT